MIAASVEPLFLELTNTIFLQACACQKFPTIDQIVLPQANIAHTLWDVDWARSANPSSLADHWPALVISYILNEDEPHSMTGHVVAQLIGTVCYIQEGHGFDSWWCHWNFWLTYSSQLHYSPGVEPSSNGIEYLEYFQGVKAAGV